MEISPPIKSTDWNGSRVILADLLLELVKQNVNEPVYWCSEDEKFYTRSQVKRIYKESDLGEEYENFEYYLEACDPRNNGTMERL